MTLDGAVVARVFDRLLARAEAIGGVRGRGLPGQDGSRRSSTCGSRRRPARPGLGYQKATEAGQQIVGLLHRPGERAVGRPDRGESMRETENEINLLRPAELRMFDPVYERARVDFGRRRDAATDAATD